MKKTIIFFLLLSSVIVFSSLRLAEDSGCGNGTGRKSAGPPSCYAGELPNNYTCATVGCHDSYSIDSGHAQVFLSLDDTTPTYQLGKSYTVTIGITRKGLVRGGFQAVVLQDNKLSFSPGVITLTDLIRTQRIDAANPHPGPCSTLQKVWIEHTSSGIDDVSNDTLKWQFQWQAPDSNVGSITFHAAALESNNDLGDSGDTVYTVKRTLAAPVILSITNLQESNMKIYPNPFFETIFIQNALVDNFSIIDMNGRLILQGVLQKGDNTILTNQLSSGIYFLETSQKRHLILKL
jgi:hypothetical protein